MSQGVFNQQLSRRLKAIRESRQLSQETAAEKLGILRNVLSNIENGKREVKAEELTKFADLFGLSVDLLLNPEKDIQVLLEPEIAERKPETCLRISVPQKKMDKFKQTLLYILEQVGGKPNIGETVLYKLLYFIDFNFYEKYEEQLIGATYIKNRYGPTPREFLKAVEEMEGREIVRVADKYFKYPQRKYLPLKKADLKNFSAEEKETIDDALRKLSDMNAQQISDYSHLDVPWLTAGEGQPIDYESVFYRTPPYSVRTYAEESD